MVIDRRILVGTIAAGLGAGTFLLLSAGSPLNWPFTGPGSGVPALLLAVLLLGIALACAVLHGLTLYLQRKQLGLIPRRALIHTSFVLPLVAMPAAVLASRLPLDPRYVGHATGLILAALGYVVVLRGWLGFLAGSVFGDSPRKVARASVWLAWVLGYWAWLYRAKVAWVRLVIAIAIHVVGGQAAMDLAGRYVSGRLSLFGLSVNSELLAAVAALLVTALLWAWAIWDARRYRRSVEVQYRRLMGALG